MDFRSFFFVLVLFLLMGCLQGPPEDESTTILSTSTLSSTSTTSTMSTTSTTLSEENYSAIIAGRYLTDSPDTVRLFKWCDSGASVGIDEECPHSREWYHDVYIGAANSPKTKNESFPLTITVKGLPQNEDGTYQYVVPAEAQIVHSGDEPIPMVTVPIGTVNLHTGLSDAVCYVDEIGILANGTAIDSGDAHTPGEGPVGSLLYSWGPKFTHTYVSAKCRQSGNMYVAKEVVTIRIIWK